LNFADICVLFKVGKPAEADEQAAPCGEQGVIACSFFLREAFWVDYCRSAKMLAVALPRMLGFVARKGILILFRAYVECSFASFGRKIIGTLC
jgi:hypothetical protein